MTRPSFFATLLAAASALTTVFAIASESEICPTIYADYHRRQLAHFSDEGAFVLKEGETAKHIPFLTLSEDGKTGTVIVGNGDEDGGVWHPMKASEDPGEVHFVTHIMVKDQVSLILISFKLLFECFMLFITNTKILFIQTRMAKLLLLNRWTQLSKLLPG